MAYSLHSLRRIVYRLILAQFALVAATAIYFYLKQGNELLLAAFYGGAITLINTLMSAWRIAAATNVAGQDAVPGVVEFYKTAVLRLILAIALLVIGLVGLELQPMALIVGFIAGSLGHFFVPLYRLRV